MKSEGVVSPIAREVFDVKCMLIHTAMLNVMRRVSIASNKRKHHQGFRYVGHDDVTEALRDAFLEQSIIQFVDVLEEQRNPATGVVSVKIEVTWLCTLDDSAVKVTTFGESLPTIKKNGEIYTDDLQTGKAVSYAVKTAQLKNFMLLGGIPDNEESEPPRANENIPPKRLEGARPPKKEVSSEQVRLLVEDYNRVSSRDELGALRQAVGALIDSLDETSYTELQAADSAAASRVG